MAFRRLAASVAPFCLIALSTACGSSSSPTTSTTDASTSGETSEDAGTVSCDKEPGLDTYVANLTKTGKSNVSFVLVSGDPAPPARGTNTWNVKISGADGAPLDGAQVDVKPFMPKHGHGSSVVPTVTPTGAGTYAITNLNLFMPGLWTITITAKSGTTTDSAVFTFCIAG